MNAEEANDHLEWGGDPYSAMMNNQISQMPDRPKVILALLKFGRESDGKIEQAFGDLPNNYLRTFPLSYLDRPFRIVCIGFDEADSAMPLAITKLSSEIWDEGAIYVDGKAIALLERPIHKEPISREAYFASQK